MARVDISVKIMVGYLVFFALHACNSKDKSDSLKIDTTKKVAKTDLNGKGTKKGNLDTIVISGMQFKPSELHLNKGDTVVWLNKDIVVHDASQFPTKGWTSGPLNPGDTWKMKIDESLDYFCSIHITMKGKLIVDP